MISLDQADFTRCRKPVSLIFSIDFSGKDDVYKVAEMYNWPYGEKLVVKHPKNIGLRKNVIHCGSYAESFPLAIVLEDDSVVSPGFVDYVLATYEMYVSDELVAQISLYSYEYDEIAYDRFHPLYEGYDGYLMQWASSRGQYWTTRQWNDFKEWYQKNEESDLTELEIPPSVKKWPVTSWKKYFIAYLVESGKFTLYPYEGYVTNYGDTGQHWREMPHPLVQVPIALRAPSEFRLAKAEKMRIRYDCFFQPLPDLLNSLNKRLESYEYSVDLNCVRDPRAVKTAYLLLGRAVDKAEIIFGKGLLPVELNFLLRQESGVISLVKTGDVTDPMSLGAADELRLWNRRIILSPVQEAKYLGVRLFAYFQRRISQSTKLKFLSRLFRDQS